MKYIVVGAGISGLSIGQILKEHGHDVQLFEADSRPGGMVKCDRVHGHLFHRTGGHVFNTKRQDVFDWFWSHFDKKEEFTKADRNSVVSMPDNTIVTYPIENHAYQLSDEMMKNFINDIVSMATNKPAEPTNFEEFLRARFGETLYREYFRPYNEKIWRRPLTNVPLSWLVGKLPMPTLEDIIYNNFKHIEERSFVHSSFFYPKIDGSQFVANRLSKGLNIHYNVEVISIEKVPDGWLVNEEVCDKIIFSGNIKDLPLIVKGIDLSGYIEGVRALEAHGTTTVLCEVEDNPYSWIYMPSCIHEAHRIICTGNFATSNRAHGVMSATVEFTGEIDKKNILDNLSRIPYQPRYISHHYAPYTYPIQAIDTRKFINSIKSITEPKGLYLLGRFAEWEYYNMDVVMGAALDLYNNVLK